MVESHDPISLPYDLPVPIDDGAADHLIGLPLPHLSFPSTQAMDLDLADLGRDRLVLYVYPRTGRPGVPPPPGWDEVPGARGCTPQSCAFRDRHSHFAKLGFAIGGLSAQTSEDQAEAATRLHLPYPLLSDPALRLAAALDLPTFTIAGMTLYKRLTLVAQEGEVSKVFYPVFPSDENPAEVLAWLARGDPPRESGR